ncbi:Quinohemoprotein amine dehydrogenase radical SAM maturase [hydrothermal vent metagenome]|uniref:Quinohemoprotein amine dehydrogenase radical SAM maturase n=1 Tax=hydrothermal vent metagenome TaxID=652676 RepID=A0A3B0RBR3_9ZZZZ
MAAGLEYISKNAHDVRVDDKRILFHIPTTSLFDLDAASGDVLDLFKEKLTVSQPDMEAAFKGRHTPDRLLAVVEDFLAMDIIRGDGPFRPDNPAIKIENYPLSTIILNVNTGCNLGCSYCYKEDLTTPAKGELMGFDVARKSIDLLLEEGKSRDRVNVVFFGGEPLSNMPLIKSAVEYAERRCGEQDKKVDFSLTTNATLLTEDIIDYLNDHKFGIAISMDGPKAIHDKNRKTIGGKGTYDVVAKKARLLLERYTARPVGARVTLTAGVTDVVGIHNHLKYDLGFAEVGFAPVTSGDISLFNLSNDELHEVFRNMKKLGQHYLREALMGRNNGFSNMHQMMTDLYEGTRKSLPCGAGIGLLAVDHEGGLNLCHRFTGSDIDKYGTVDSGIKKRELGEFLESRADRDGTWCDSCRIRNLCSGGCYHESYATYDDINKPTYHYCDLMRDWIDFGIGVYARILHENPRFFEQHVSPRTLLNTGRTINPLDMGK